MNPVIIFADREGEDYPSCPLRSDVNSCNACSNSKVNDCPKMDDSDIYRLPDWCPLKSGGVLVKFKE